MKKLAVAIALMLSAIVANAADRATTPEITPPANGEEFLRLSSTEKLFWSIGYSQGYLDALNKIDVAAGANSACASLAARTERQSSTAAPEGRCATNTFSRRPTVPAWAMSARVAWTICGVLR